MLRWIILVYTLFLFSGCATKNYVSDRSAIEVSECIASGWRKSPFSGFEVPVSVTKFEQYYFVGVELHPTFQSLLITGAEHPFYAVWAEVQDTFQGSSTKYHRAYQFTHGNIDQVIIDCQNSHK